MRKNAGRKTSCKQVAWPKDLLPILNKEAHDLRLSFSAYIRNLVAEARNKDV